MNKKSLRILIVILELLSVVCVLSMCIMGMVYKCNMETQLKFIEAMIRCTAISVFAFFYYFSFSRNFESSGIFMPLYILFAVLSELRIADDFTRITYQIFIPPQVLVYLFLFANIMMALSLIGFSTFYDLADQKSVGRYIYTMALVGALVAYILPRPQKLSELWNNGVILYTVVLLFGLCGVTSIILMLTNSHGTNIIRHFAVLLFATNNCLNVFYDTYIMNIVGTAVFVLACALIIVVSKINEVRM